MNATATECRCGLQLKEILNHGVRTGVFGCSHCDRVCTKATGMCARCRKLTGA